MSGLPLAGPQKRNYVPIDHNDHLKQACETRLQRYQVLHDQRQRVES